MLAVVHLGAGARSGPRCDGIGEVAEPQHVPVHHQAGDIVVGTQDRQHDSAAIVQLPVDVEVRRVRRVAAVLQHVPPPLVLLWLLDADVVGDDVDDQTHATRPRRLREPGQPLGAAQLRRHGGGVGDVVTVCGAAHRGQDRGQVEVRHSEVVEVGQQVLGVGERETVTTHL